MADASPYPRLAHFRHPEEGESIWDGSRWITPGPSPTVQFHDTPIPVLDSEVTIKTQEGTSVSPAHYTTVPEVPVQNPVMGSYFLSDPVIWQSYFQVRWEHLHGARADLAEGTRKLTPLANPNAPGRAAGQALMPYNPYPAATDIYPSYPFVYGEPKAV